MEEETSLLKYTATNGKNELPMFFIKDMNHSKPIYIASIPNRCTQHQPKNKLQSINPIATYPSQSLFCWFVKSESFDSSQHPAPPCHSARSRRRSRRIHHPKNNPRPPGEGGPSQTVGEGGEEHFPPPLIRLDVHLLPREKGYLRFLKCGFCNSGASPPCRMTCE